MVSILKRASERNPVIIALIRAAFVSSEVHSLLAHSTAPVEPVSIADQPPFECVPRIEPRPVRRDEIVVVNVAPTAATGIPVFRFAPEDFAANIHHRPSNSNVNGATGF